MSIAALNLPYPYLLPPTPTRTRTRTRTPSPSPTPTPTATATRSPTQVAVAAVNLAVLCHRGRTASPGESPISHLYLPVSPLYLPCISPHQARVHTGAPMGKHGIVGWMPGFHSNFLEVSVRLLTP